MTIRGQNQRACPFKFRLFDAVKTNVNEKAVQEVFTIWNEKQFISNFYCFTHSTYLLFNLQIHPQFCMTSCDCFWAANNRPEPSKMPQSPKNYLACVIIKCPGDSYATIPDYIINVDVLSESRETRVSTVELLRENSQTRKIGKCIFIG